MHALAIQGKARGETFPLGMDDNLKILILEDAAADARAMERELRHANMAFCARRVETKVDFLKALEDFSPDLILADYSLPAFTGLEALRLVQESRANIPLIIVTGSLNEETAAHCIKEGAADYVIKEHLMRLPSAVKGATEKKKITEEKAQAAGILRQQNQFLNDILESLTHPFLVIDARDRVIRMANSSARKNMGINGGLSCREATGCRDGLNQDAYACSLEAVRKTKQPAVIEQVYQFKNSVPRNFEVHSYPVFDREGDIAQVIAYFIDITDRKRAEEQIRRSLQEKEILLKEIYHRVKNNLQIISSLINLQGRDIKGDGRIPEMFKKSRDRIQAMALIHEKLYQSRDMTRIDFVVYIRDLIAHLFCSYGVAPDVIALKIAVNGVHLDINTAIPCGLIVNELVSNSLKHAFPEGFRGGEISVALFSHEDRVFNLVIGDNGVGFRSDVNFQDVKSLGLQLVKTLVDQIGGEIDVRVNGGTTFRIVFTPVRQARADGFNAEIDR